MMCVSGWLVAYGCRWLPHRSPTGLFPIGSPGKCSPVIVTANFSLTVNRVRRALGQQDLWLLVANSEGINVWCAAASGVFNEHRVVDAIKVSGLSEKVAHHDLILPGLSASGIECKTIEEETGFRARFGPVYAEDVPAYLKAGRKKTDAMRRFRAGLRHRLDMFFSMNFPVYLALAVVLAIFWPHYLAGATLLYWSALAVLYSFIDILPGKTGWAQVAFAASAFVALWAGMDWIVSGNPLLHWGWLIAVPVVFFACGFDLAGIVLAKRSDPERLLIRLRFKKVGAVFREKEIGVVTLDREKCTGCGNCRDVCPVEVYAGLDEDHKTTLRDRDACFACGACVKQCPESALSLQGG